MSPSAVVLAALLHALVGLALWWIAEHPPRLPPVETPIEVTVVEPVKPPPPPPPKPEPKREPPRSIMRLGLAPPAAITADKPSQVAPKADKESPGQPAEAMVREPPTLEQELPQPAPPEPPPPEQAFASPKPAPTPPRPAPQVPQPQLPARQAPPPTVTPSPPMQQQGVRPSPLVPNPQRRPSASARAEEPSVSAFVNPADVYNRARVADNYLWQVVRKLEGYRFQANVATREGTTVIRVVIARDGRLLDVSIAQSSGFPLLDQGVLTGVRNGSPYAPLPPDIKGDSATFTLPLVSVYRR